MQIDQETFSSILPSIIESWRTNRQWNLRQRKLPGLLKDWHRARLLQLQAAYMLISRGQVPVENSMNASELSGDDAAVMQNLMNWIDGLTSAKLFAVVNGSADADSLLLCLIGLYIDHNDMGLEIDRRLQPKRFAVELIRTHWGEPDENEEKEQVKKLEGLLKSYKTKQFAPGLEERYLKDSAHEEIVINGKRHSDFNQSNWVRTLELWNEQIETSLKKRQTERADLTWFEWLPLFQAEKNFFEGPIRRAWQGSLNKVLADYDAIPEVDLIPRKLRGVKEAAVETIERRRSKTEHSNTDHLDEDPLLEAQAFSNWKNEERN